MIVLMIIWLVGGLATACVAGSRGELATGVIAGALLGPFGIPIAFISQGSPRCSRCQGLVSQRAQACAHCGATFQ